MDNERKTPTFDQLPEAVGELLDKVDYVISRLDEPKDVKMESSGNDNNDLLTLDEACKFIGKARSTMYALTSENRIPYRKCGNKLYFFKNELLEWIKNGGTFDPAQMPTVRNQAAFEAHARELRSQKKNKPLTIKRRKDNDYDK